MKKIFIAILFVLPFLGFAQAKKSIDGFMDIPFGSDSATVKTAIAAKDGIQNYTQSTKNALVFNNLTLSGRNVSKLLVVFVDNKAYQATFEFRDFAEIDALSYYDLFSRDITAIYGKGTIKNNFGDSNNSQRIRRLLNGNASCSTIWVSKSKNALDLLFATDSQSLTIYLSYVCGSLSQQDDAKKRSDL